MERQTSDTNEWDGSSEYWAHHDELLAAEDYARSTRNDGWWAAFLIGMLFYGPQTPPFAVLPPIRSVDAVILLLWLVRWVKASRYYGGFLLSYRAKLFSMFMLGMTAMLVFSMLINIVTGRAPFFVKDLFIPIVFIRMVIIGAIGASFNFQERQIKQFFKGIIAISLVTVFVAFAQRFQAFGITTLTHKLYAIDFARLETMATLKSRVAGSFGNANIFGAGLVMLAGVLMAIAINVKGVLKYLSIATYVGLAMAVMVTTASRTALLGLVAVSGFSVILSLRRGSRLWALMLMVLIGAGLMFVRAHAYELPLLPRVQEILTGEGSMTQDAFNARWGIWMRSLARARESILFGTGASKITAQLTDNGYFYTLLRIGILGLILYMSMLAALLVRGLRVLFKEGGHYQRAVLMAFIVVLINHSIFEVTADIFWGIQYGAIFAAFMGMLCGFTGQIIYEDDDSRAYEYQSAELEDGNEEFAYGL